MTTPVGAPIALVAADVIAGAVASLGAERLILEVQKADVPQLARIHGHLADLDRVASVLRSLSDADLLAPSSATLHARLTVRVAPKDLPAAQSSARRRG